MMSQFHRPGFLESIFAMAASTLGQATLVIAVAAILAGIFRRNAAARHAIWLCALLAVLLGPVVAIIVETTGWSVVTIPPIMVSRSGPYLPRTVRKIPSPRRRRKKQREHPIP
jgi:hypothetical protein